MEIDPKAFLFLSCVNGAMAAFFAKSRQKNPYLWFGIGFMFGLIGIFYLFYLTSKKKAAPQTPVRQPVVQLPPQGASKMWYYLDSENKQFGPMSYQALGNAKSEGKITPATYVWNEDFSEWKKLEEIPL